MVLSEVVGAVVFQTVYLVQFFEFPGISTSLDGFIVELIRIRSYCELWAREFGQRMEVDSVDNDPC